MSYRTGRLMILGALVGVLAYFLVHIPGGFSSDSYSDSGSERDLVRHVAQLVRDQYVDTIEPEKFFNGGLSALANRLDPLSCYLDTSRSEIFRAFQDGHAGSLGIFGFVSPQGFRVTVVRKDSPADLAGISHGFTLTHVDGISLSDSSHWTGVLALWSPGPKEMEIDLVAETGRKRRLKLASAFVTPEAQVVELSSGTVLIKIPRLDTATINYLLRHDIWLAAERWLVDLRCYSGGDMESFLRLARMLLWQPVELEMVKRDGSQRISLGEVRPTPRSVMVIVDRSTFALAEVLARMMNRAGAILAGGSLPGYTSAVSQFDLGDGSSFLLSTVMFRLPGAPEPAEPLEATVPLTPAETVDLERHPLDFFKRIQ